MEVIGVDDLSKEESWPNPPFMCPQCHSTAIEITPLRGEEGFWFVDLRCSRCCEYGFFQTESVAFLEVESGLEEGPPSVALLQQEWQEWFTWKQRHLSPRPLSAARRKNYDYGLAFLLLIGSLFFIADQYHLFGIFSEDVSARQRIVHHYVEYLKKSSCLSLAMKAKLETVPILYTSESALHHEKIQYGETGTYGGEMRIKIYRSNFWFFGKPKSAQLIHTLIHELHHRVHPYLEHSPRFYQLVDRDTGCVLKYWNKWA
ncbi:hypothetical protein WDW89_13230 [Deltaproteobacteria bacterium TL4]